MKIETIIVFLGLLMFYGLAFILCRSCSAYFDEAKCKRYITIKSPALRTLLISRTYKSRKTGRLLKVPFFYEGRMSYVGLFAHILIQLVGIAMMVTFLLEALQIITSTGLDTVLLGSLAFLMVFFSIIDVVNNREV